MSCTGVGAVGAVGHIANEAGAVGEGEVVERRKARAAATSSTQPAARVQAKNTSAIERIEVACALNAEVIRRASVAVGNSADQTIGDVIDDREHEKRRANGAIIVSFAAEAALAGVARDTVKSIRAWD